MLDFANPPIFEPKSPEEQEFDRLNEEYKAMFGNGFGFSYGFSYSNWEEVIADIKECIRTEKPQVIPKRDLGSIIL